MKFSLNCFGPSDEKKPSVLLQDDRGKAHICFLEKAHEDQVLSRVIGLGGSGGTSLIFSVFKSLSIGLPKVIVSTDLCKFTSVTTECVNAVKERLEREGYETLVFHATGIGGRAFEDMVKGGFIQGVLDITTTEVADYMVGGVMACDSSRFDSILR